ncbi:hypothetical protein FB567DRAFT_446131 [Paraphoma chrysanthemicola]|uniref:Uncharacterized protein n=1 Tax=Paraphoma chrysanthemicola TaxID=798071 RepID=A0A8K0R2D8_9PLEO|nr:hypothetical protein FB567DRAFT_446131 [Paraphoma chrysanthemicola]
MATTHNPCRRPESAATTEDRLHHKEPDSHNPSASGNLQDASTEQAPSPITELQAVFGSILLARKTVEPVTTHSKSLVWDTYTQTFRRTQAAPALTPEMLPRWNGAFDLFSFPRELRDRIYYHYVYRPKGVHYHRTTTRSFPFMDYPDDITSLFLTSKQVYDEALQVFCRYNQIEIKTPGYWAYRSNDSRALTGTLRLFPDKPGRLVQRVRKRYREYIHVYGSYASDHLGQRAGDALLQMFRDAYTFKNAFAKLREFTVVWEANPHFFATQDNLHFDDKSEEEKVQVWLNWMKKALHGSNIVPPRWITFEFDSNWRKNEMHANQSALNEAYARLVRESGTWDEQQAMLEESGRKWLEEVSVLDKKKRRKNKKQRS